MVIIIDRNTSEDMALNGDFHIVDSERIEDTILNYVLKDEVVVALYPDAYRRLPRLFDRIKSEGGNPYLYEPVSTKHAHVLGSELLQYYLKMKEKILYKTKPWKAHYRITLTKKVSRRALLRTPINAIREYIAAPIMSDPIKCESITRCNNCIMACPNEALRGKPPEVLIESCTGCGICMAQCPFDLIVMPGWSTQKIIDAIDTVRKMCNEITVIISTRSQAAVIDDILDIVGGLVIVDLVDKVDWVNERIIIALLMRGANRIIVYYNPDEEHGQPSFSRLISQGLPIYLIKSVKELDRIQQLLRTHTNQVRPGRIQVNTHTPVKGMIRVTEDCSLCGACEAICPTGAITQKTVEDEFMLFFRHDRCVACKLCESVCPHNALVASYIVDTDMFGKESTLAKDKIARCRRCGQPLGPMSRIRRLESILREKGHNSKVIESLWLCDKCKEIEYSMIYTGIIKRE